MVRIERGEGRRGGEAGVIGGLKRRGGASNGCGAQPVVVALLPWAPGVQLAKRGVWLGLVLLAFFVLITGDVGRL